MSKKKMARKISGLLLTHLLFSKQMRKAGSKVLKARKHRDRVRRRSLKKKGEFAVKTANLVPVVKDAVKANVKQKISRSGSRSGENQAVATVKEAVGRELKQAILPAVKKETGQKILKMVLPSVTRAVGRFSDGRA